MVHDDKTRELIERYCSGVDRNVVLSRSVADKRCVCLNRENCDKRKSCKYDFCMDDANKMQQEIF